MSENLTPEDFKKNLLKFEKRPGKIPPPPPHSANRSRQEAQVLDAVNDVRRSLKTIEATLRDIDKELSKRVTDLEDAHKHLNGRFHRLTQVLHEKLGWLFR